jgi:hypothetical protein
MHTRFGLENLKGRVLLEELGVNDKILLKFMLMKSDSKVCSALSGSG